MEKKIHCILEEIRSVPALSLHLKEQFSFKLAKDWCHQQNLIF